MAKAFKCDRCGVYFDAFEWTDNTVIMATSKALDDHYSFGHVNPKMLTEDDMVFELCPSCQEKLEKFLKGVDYDVVPVMSTEE